MSALITVVGLGSGAEGEMTLGAAKALREASNVFLRTSRHPSAGWLESNGVSFTSFDTYYEEASSFDEVYSRIAHALLSLGEDAVYAVPGSAVYAESSVRMLSQMSAGTGTGVKILPAVSFVDSVLACLGEDGASSYKLLDAQRLDVQTPDPSCLNLVCQIYDRDTASDAKLALMRHYRDETPVVMIAGAGTEGCVMSPMRLFEIDQGAFPVDHLTTLAIPAASPADAAGSFASLEKTVEILRGPDGCPWDRAQTRGSLLGQFVEEVYEACDAAGDDEAFCEELGDVLLHVMLQSAIASEEGAFTASDVIRALTLKLMRRHPDVFPEYAGDLAGAGWEEIKKIEKGGSSYSGRAAMVASNLPAAIYAAKTGRILSSSPLGAFCGAGARERAARAAGGLLRASGEDLGQAAGDLLFEAACAAEAAGEDPETLMKDAAKRAASRMKDFETLLEAAGKRLEDMSAGDADQYWNSSKF